MQYKEKYKKKKIATDMCIIVSCTHHGSTKEISDTMAYDKIDIQRVQGI